GGGGPAVPGLRPCRGLRRRGRGDPSALPLPRPAPFRPGEDDASALGGQQGRTGGPRCPRLLRGRDTDPDEVDSCRRPRLPRTCPAQARLLVRPAPVPAAVQTAAPGRGHGTLLPDRSLLP